MSRKSVNIGEWRATELLSVLSLFFLLLAFFMLFLFLNLLGYGVCGLLWFGVYIGT